MKRFLEKTSQEKNLKRGCNEMVNPVGNRVVVKTMEIEEKSEGGIIIPDDARQAVQFAMTTGYFVAAGERAWVDWGGTPWAEEGQKVVFAKYGGSPFQQNAPEEGNRKIGFRLLNDEDILAVDDGLPFDEERFNKLVAKKNKSAEIKIKIGDV